MLGYRSHPYVGGQGIYLYYLSQALAEYGHQVTMFSGQPYPDVPENVKLRKVPGLNLYDPESSLREIKLRKLRSRADIHEWLSKLSGGFAEPQTFGTRLYNKHFEELTSFDIIHDNQSLCYALTRLAKHNCKVVATIHHPIHIDRKIALESTSDSFKKLLVRRWYSFIKMQEKVVNSLPSLITVSEASKIDIAHYFSCAPKKITVIPNGVDTSTFKPLKVVPAGEQRIITTTSSDQPLKGLKYLLQAMHALKRTLPYLRLLVIGQLNEQSETARILRELELSDCVEFASGLSTQELVKKYNSSLLAVCPSIYEGFGMPALEAMACGIPVVSTDGGALPEVIGDAGLIVPAGNADALARGVETLICDRRKRDALSQRALRRVQNHYSWTSIAELYTQYYLQILRRPN